MILRLTNARYIAVFYGHPCFWTSSRQAADKYIADLRAASQIKLDLLLFRMNKLGMPQERISERLGIPQKTIHNQNAIDGKMAK